MPARTVARLAVRRTVDEAVHGAFTAEQLSIVAWFVPMKSFGVEASYLALMVAATFAVVPVTELTAPVVASGIAVMTAMPSLVLPPLPCEWPKGAFEVPSTFVRLVQAPVTEAHEDPPPPPEPFPPPPP